VSGTIGGATYGIAKGVTIVPVRTFTCEGRAPASTIIAAFEWVVAHKTGPSVLNYSAGGSGNTAIDAAAQAVINAGITLVVAAGNDAWDSCYDSPARVPGALTVGASDGTDTAPWFSNYGDCIDLFAPGVDITSAWYTSDTEFNTISGTSMATPHVVGAAARYLETHPSAAPAEVADFVNASATPGIVSEAYSANNRLLYVDSGVAAPPPVAVVPTPTPAPVLPPAPAPAPTPTVAPPAALPPVRTKLHVTKVRYNGPGSDTKRNRNTEWVRITNTSGTAYSLKNYRLKDGDGSTYTFPATTLGAKKYIYVYTGKGTNTSTTRYWNNAQHVWDNKGSESVTLLDTYRRTVNKHSWTSKKAGEVTWS
jgi:subtilisin family serine protease